MAQLHSSLTEKYGQPNEQFKTQMGNDWTLTWIEAGKPQCWRNAERQTSGFQVADPGLKTLEQIARFQQQVPSLPRDFSTCGATLRTSSYGEPVHSFRTEMTDFAYWLTSLTETNAWVSAQIEKATKERTAQGATPQL